MRYNLSELTEIIRNRRTVYPEFYTDRPVHREQVEKILNNAIWAPTHGLTQPWTFKVFLGGSRQKLSQFLGELYATKNQGELFDPKRSEKIQMRAMKAGAAIVVSLKRDPAGKISEMEEIEAVACGIQNMYLTCTAWGLGCCWVTPKILYTPEMNEFLGLGTNDKCLGLFYVGYLPPEFEWPRSRRRPLEYFTQWVEE
jgi:nitroreductase